ncbi:DUF6560 family protein [Eubacterium ventriosum]|uniref:DUF6560 family protein n=1 Tax=Eubacterium ventriosum TaxID=39496 RepID=UPI00351F8DB7
MKALECYQPRGIAKLLFYLFLLWTVICCISVISNNDYFIEGIVCSIFFDMTIFLIIFGIFVYKITVYNDQIVIRKWYGRRVKVNFDDSTKVVFATLSGKPVDATRIHMYKGKKKVLSLDPVMENYDKMKKYLLEHIDETKIDTIS